MTSFISIPVMTVKEEGKVFSVHLSHLLQTLQQEAVVSQGGQVRFGHQQTEADVKRQLLFSSQLLGIDQSPVI